VEEIPQINVINKTLFKPRFVAPPIPTFRTTLEHERWLATEIKRWREGYSGLTGAHYAYLTIGSLKTADGDIIRPRWRDGDEMVFLEDEDSQKNSEDLMIIKRREFGLTSIYGGFKPIYNCLLFPGTTNLLTSADSKRVEDLFAEKTMIMYSGLPLPKTQDKKGDWEFKDLPMLRKTQKGSLELGREDKFGNRITKISKVICKQTNKDHSSAKGFEAYRAKSIFLDELFLHSYAEIVHASAQSTIMRDFIKVGHMVFGGSCGLDATATKDDVENLKKGSAMGERLWYDAEVKGIRRVFIPGWMCIDEAMELDDRGRSTGKKLSFMKNGHSDEKRATEWILKKRSILEKASDKDLLRNFIKQYPLTVEEVFAINREIVFPPSVYDALERAAAICRENAGIYSPSKLWRREKAV
jgi:hypothetical protein